ncbi:hypothetical protein Y032_0051g2096 [Ancylostoma ceylanicum]|uniref:RRM domain-containing protein n=1 Tax=Ancylostoma ceylanicum TaxID=53326 RepID=A0A016U7E2_9BILA|nr:hypothetical protein Y032_0051g2096 [Ancylostoma ceylanicum]
MSRRGDYEAKVYIGGLPHDATSQEIEDAFHRFGRIRKVWVARRPPGFAFVEFEDTRDAEDAVKSLDGALNFDGYKIVLVIVPGESVEYAHVLNSHMESVVMAQVVVVVEAEVMVVEAAAAEVVMAVEAMEADDRGLALAAALHHDVGRGRVLQTTEGATAGSLRSYMCDLELVIASPY